MSLNLSPSIINIYKPKDMTSYDVVRVFKRKLSKKSKLGHFGTLDPFATGVLMIGIHGAQRLNEYIHDCLPKTYIATGVLGISTETGDLTVEPDQIDESDYLNEVISKFDIEFIQEKLQESFIGEYMQSPHKYSAAKFEGKSLHKWAREGVEIKKEQKKRHVYDIKVLSYEFPKLKVEYTVSSGTYIRTLFSDCAALIGTLGTLEDLERTKIGNCNIGNALKKENWDQENIQTIEMDKVLNFPSLIMEKKEATLYSNGVKLKTDRAKTEVQGELDFPFRWIKNTDSKILGLAQICNGEIHPKVNFSLSSL